MSEANCLQHSVLQQLLATKRMLHHEGIRKKYTTPDMFVAQIFNFCRVAKVQWIARRTASVMAPFRGLSFLLRSQKSLLHLHRAKAWCTRLTFRATVQLWGTSLLSQVCVVVRWIVLYQWCWGIEKDENDKEHAAVERRLKFYFLMFSSRTASTRH